MIVYCFFPFGRDVVVAVVDVEVDAVVVDRMLYFGQYIVGGCVSLYIIEIIHSTRCISVLLLLVFGAVPTVL